MAEDNDYMLKADRDAKAAKLERQRQEWNEKRARGKWFYLFNESVLVWGGTLFLAFASFDCFLEADRPAFLIKRIAIDAVACFVCGLFFGYIEWHWQEGRFGTSQKRIDPSKGASQS